jgi:glutamine amidotransferase
MIAIIDYGKGNLASVKKLCKTWLPGYTTSNPDEIRGAEKVILPGVGAFADAIKNLRRLGIDQVIHELVAGQVPLLGICLGMQLFFSESYENGLYKGLDVIPGRVVKFDIKLKVPHMGWNSIDIKENSRILAGIPSGSYYYFVHSYYVQPDDPSYIAARSNYEIDFTCAVEKGNLFGTQFHPEKSSDLGLKILSNFGEM